MLGPLCVAMSIVAIADADPSDGPPDLWSRLDAVVCTTPRDAKRRIAVADSKRLKGSNQANRYKKTQQNRYTNTIIYSLF